MSDVTPYLSVPNTVQVNQQIRPKTALALRYQQNNKLLKDTCCNSSLPFAGSKETNLYKAGECSHSKCGRKVSFVKFLTVSETVLAAQALIKSYRRQQSIEKATELLRDKSTICSLNNAPTFEAKAKFRRAANVVMAGNAYKRNLQTNII